MVIVGESPGYNEAREGKPFVGQSGILLRKCIRAAGLDPERDVYYTNAALCLPERHDSETYKTSRTKKLAAVHCRGRLKAELIPYMQSGVPVLGLGGAASLVLAGKEAIGSVRGQWFQNNKVIVTWHPAYILRAPPRLNEMLADIKKAIYGHPQYLDMNEPTYRIITTVDEFRDFAHELMRMCRDGEIFDSAVVIDIETSNVDWWSDDFIICWAFAWDIDKAAVVSNDIIHEPEVRDLMIELFEPESGIKWLGHNIKFDLRFLRHQLGIHNVRVDYDSLVADYVLDENRRHALKDLLSDNYGVPDYEAGLVQKYLSSKNDDYSKVPLPEMYHYVVYDVCYTMYLWRDLHRQLIAEGLFDQPFLYPLMASQEPFLEIELRGMLVDRNVLDGLSTGFRQRLDEMQAELERMCHKTFNPNSWMQVSEIMYGYYHMPKHKARGVSNAASTAKPIRDLIMHQYIEEGKTPATHEPFKWIDLYHQWKQIEKLRSSYVDNMYIQMDENDRVHPDVLVYGTETGRPSVRNPALQTIPRPGTGSAAGEVWGVRIKRMFVAPAGYKIVQVDYSQAELRTAAAISGDPFLKGCYIDGRDIHGEVAEAFFPGWTTMEDKFERKHLRDEFAKKSVFARLYLGTEYAIAGIFGIPPKQAVKYLRILDAKLGGLVQFEHEQFERMRTQGYVTTLTGRRRRMPLITRDNIEDARKAAANAPVQGMASDLTVMSLIEVWQWIKEQRKVDPRYYNVNLLITVHDSILLEVPDELVHAVAAKVVAIMEEVGYRWMPQMTWKADADVGQNWGDLKPLQSFVPTVASR